MFKKSLITLTLAAGALLTMPATAAIVSLDVAGLLSSGSNITGTISWDSASAPYQPGMGGAIQYYTLQSLSLFIDGQDLAGTSHVTNAFLSVEKSGSMDYVGIYVSADSVTATSAFAAFVFQLDFRAAPDAMLDSRAAPGSLDFIGNASGTGMRFAASGADGQSVQGLWVESITRVAATPDTTPPADNTVPEPGSLLLASMAGLALTATRRRKALAA